MFYAVYISSCYKQPNHVDFGDPYKDHLLVASKYKINANIFIMPINLAHLLSLGLVATSYVCHAHTKCYWNLNGNWLANIYVINT